MFVVGFVRPLDVLYICFVLCWMMTFVVHKSWVKGQLIVCVFFAFFAPEAAWGTAIFFAFFYFFSWLSSRFWYWLVVLEGVRSCRVNFVEISELACICID